MNFTGYSNLTIQPRQSMLLLKALVIAHGLAMVSIFLLTVTVVVQVLLVVAVVIHFGLMIKYCLYQPSYQIRYDPVLHWQLAEHDQEFAMIELLNSTLTTTVLVILHAKLASGKVRHLLIFKDSLSVNEFRQLRAKIRMSAIDMPLD